MAKQSATAITADAPSATKATRRRPAKKNQPIASRDGTPTAPLSPIVRWVGVVTAEVLNVRSGPGLDQAVIGNLVNLSQVQVVEQIGEWLGIVWNGATAFVNAQFVVNRDAASPLPAAIDERLLPLGADAAAVAVANTWQRHRILIERESARLGIDPAVAVAILVAESNGDPFGPDGRMIIRFENHIFYDQWGKENEARFHQHFTFDPATLWQGHQWRADGNGAWQPCHISQPMEWLLFDFACTLDPSAAMKSISMGAPQIMGFNHHLIGYGSVQEMFNAFQSEENQFSSLFRFLEVNGLVDAARQGDLRRIAAVYNGPGQADHYAAIIQRNLTAFQALQGAGTRQIAAAPSAIPGVSMITAVDLADSWQAQWREGLLKSRQIFAKTVDSITVNTLDDAIRTAQLGITINTYWAQLALFTDPTNAQNMLQSAANDALARLRDLAASRGGGTVATALVASQPAPPINVKAGGRRQALCIGIDDYAQQPLSGCVADAKLWAETLVALGFDQPTLLLNGQATRNEIVTAVRTLVSNSRPGDVIVIQYAGHGTQLRDVSGDESGGDTPQKDEALVPFDFLSGAYVLDDDLGEIFSAIPAGVNVTCFMDCCHSGSISRVLPPEDEPIPDERPRFMVADESMIAAHQRYRQQLGGSRTVGKRDIESMSEVVFSACQSTELAWEKAGHGEFTLRATSLLKNGVGSLSHTAFIQQVIAAFGPTPRQNPLMECAPVAQNRTLLQAVAA